MQIPAMHNLAAHTLKRGKDLDMQQAAQAVFRYFDTVTVQPHAVEEQGMRQCPTARWEGKDASLLNSPLPEIVSKHQHVDAA